MSPPALPRRLQSARHRTAPQSQPDPDTATNQLPALSGLPVTQKDADQPPTCSDIVAGVQAIAGDQPLLAVPLLLLLDHFLPSKCHAATEAGVLDLEAASEALADFAEASSETLAEALRRCGMTLRRGGETAVILERTSGGALAAQDVAHAVGALTEALERPGCFEFGAVVAAVSSSACRALRQTVETPAESDQWDAVCSHGVYSTDPSHGIPELEVSFAAVPASAVRQYSLLYPDLYKLTARHAELVKDDSGAERPHVHSLMRCLATPSHEVVHFVQTALGQGDSSNLAWALEHDASHLSLTLLWELCRAGSEVLRPGTAEMVRLYFAEISQRRVLRWPPELLQSYDDWATHFGVLASAGRSSFVPTTFADFTVSDFNQYYRHMKELLAVQSASFRSGGFARQARLLLDGRRGDLQQLPHPEALEPSNGPRFSGSLRVLRPAGRSRAASAAAALLRTFGD